MVLFLRSGIKLSFSDDRYCLGTDRPILKSSDLQGHYIEGADELQRSHSSNSLKAALACKTNCFCFIVSPCMIKEANQRYYLRKRFVIKFASVIIPVY